MISGDWRSQIFEKNGLNVGAMGLNQAQIEVYAIFLSFNY